MIMREAVSKVSLRFYPDQMASFPYEPTFDRFRIPRVGDKVGEGVMTCVGFYPGEVVFGFTGFFTSGSFHHTAFIFL